MKPYSTATKTVDSYWLTSRSLRNIVSTGPLSPLSQKPHGYEMTEDKWDLMTLSDLYGNKLQASAWVGYEPWDYEKLSFTSIENDRLITKHRNKIGGKALNLLDILRTRRQTVNMVTRNLLSLVKSINLLKKGKWKRAANALGVTPKGAPKSQNVPRRWLELQYGWLPLLRDIYAAGNKLFREPTFKVTTGTEKRDTSSKKSTSYLWQHYFDSTKFRDRLSRQSITTWFRIKSSAVTTLDNLGVLNPSLVAWEAVPWSFVVDWFLPVGDFLSSLTALQGVDIISTSKTVVYEVETDYVTKTRGYTKTSGSGHILEIVKNRVVPYNISVVLPSFKNPFSLSHFANGMSLLATAFKTQK